jgi:hypothetical protein
VKRNLGGRPAGQLSLARLQRIDLIEQWWMGDPDPSLRQLAAYLQESTPLPGCQQCIKPNGKKLKRDEELPTCKHGPPRAAGEDGKPLSEHAIRKDWYVVRDRLRELATVKREQNRELALRRIDEVFRRALQSGDYREALAAAARRADLDGTRQAAEEAQQPTLGDAALALCARFVDWTPEKPPRTSYTATELQVIYARGIRLAERASDSMRQGRATPPPPKEEADRRLWIQARIAEHIGEVLAAPGVAPGERRDAMVRLAGAYALGSTGAALADRVTGLERLLASIIDEESSK